MELKNEATKKYINYNDKIKEIWQDQVDAGTWGRANLKEVLGGFKNLITKINNDSELPQEYKDELGKIIKAKTDLVEDREKEILEAEKSYTEEQSNAFRNAKDRYRDLTDAERRKYNQLYKKLTMGYGIFFSVRELDEMFKGSESDKMFDSDKIKESELGKTYPIISEDLKGIIGEDKNKEEKN